MVKPLSISTSIAACAFAFVGALIGMAGTSFATSSQDNALSQVAQVQEKKPVTIEPECSDANTMKSKWKVVNQNTYDVQIDWNNFENGFTGSYLAVPGESFLYTDYNPKDGNNTTRFTYLGGSSSTNANVSACAQAPTPPTPPAVTCIDGSIQQNLVVNFVDKNIVTVITKDGMPLCDDVTIFLSSYTMPDTYNGAGFANNPTAYPQSIFASASLTLLKGTDGASILAAELPTCKNTQIDLYYGPEITQVGPNGHGTQSIVSNIYVKDAAACAPGNGGVVPPTQPPVVTPPAVVTPVGGMGAAGETPVKQTAQQLPYELPTTGGFTINPFLYALALAFISYASLYALNVRKA